jgi:hypothetical protein
LTKDALAFLAEMAARPCVKEALDPGMSHAANEWICCGICDPCRARVVAGPQLDVPV